MRRTPGLPVAITAAAAILFLAGCGAGSVRGTAWGDGTFASNGERIYFTATSDRGTAIDHEGGPGGGGMMVGGTLACASCHGLDARGGVHRMHMETMDAPNIRWVALAGDETHGGDGAGGHADGEGASHRGYDFAAFRSAVVDGTHEDGMPLSADMPRWTMSESDLRDLAEYLQGFDEP